jgi:hypothetical protein
MLCGVFPEICFTVDYSNSFHLDPNDRAFLSHSFITTPNKFVTQNLNTHGAFMIGRNGFHYDVANLCIIFSAAHVSHCTTIPSRSIEMPSILRGEKNYRSVILHEGTIKAYLKNSVLSFAAFGSTNIGWKNKKLKASKRACMT